MIMKPFSKRLMLDVISGNSSLKELKELKILEEINHTIKNEPLKIIRTNDGVIVFMFGRDYYLTFKQLEKEHRRQMQEIYDEIDREIEEEIKEYEKYEEEDDDDEDE